MRNKKLLVAVCGIVLALLLGCGKNSPQPSLSPSQDDRANHAIKTACGDLYFPEEWNDAVAVREQPTEFGSSVVFETELEGEKIILFTLNIGGGEGDEIGKLTDQNGQVRSVRMVISELHPEGVDEQSANRLFAMQEDINYLIDHLK